MDTAEKIAYWYDIALYDLQTARQMQKTKRYLYTVFLCQQSIEKMLKAFYLQRFNKEAPFTHNLVYLESLMNTGMDEAHRDLLSELTTYYIAGRYPTYKSRLSALVKRKKAEEIMAQTEGLFLWLRKKLKS